MCRVCLQGKNVTCPICQNSYPEHRLKCHIKTTHPGEQHKIHPHICCHYLYFSCYVILVCCHIIFFFHLFVFVCGQMHSQYRPRVSWWSVQRSVPTVTPISLRTAAIISDTSGPTRVWYSSTFISDKHMWLHQSRCRMFQVLMHLLSGPPSVLSPDCPPAGQTGL